MTKRKSRKKKSSQKPLLGTARSIIGLGRFDSGTPDLPSNKRHLESFGRDSLGKGQRPKETE